MPWNWVTSCIPCCRPRTSWALGVSTVSSRSPLLGQQAALNPSLEVQRRHSPILFSNIPRIPSSDLLPCNTQLWGPATGTHPEVVTSGHFAPPPPVGCCGEEETFAPTKACSRSFKHNFSQERTQVHLTAEHTSPAREIGTVNGPQTFTSEGTQNGLIGPTAVAQKQGWRGAQGWMQTRSEVQSVGARGGGSKR